MIKKDKYDIDIFLRFDRKHKQEISNLIEKLLEKTEEICKKNNIKKIIVISGIGVWEYYKKLGYKKEGVYMTKRLRI